MKILDCTLRDGSYAINFQFTAFDTAQIVGELDRVGIELIEVGHGVGLNASNRGYGEAAETDEDYLKAAVPRAKPGRVGVFCIPGVARLDDVDMAADCGAGFLRIGTNVADVDQAAPFIDRALKRGMFVCSNMMKSYATDPDEFAKVAKKC